MRPFDKFVYGLCYSGDYGLLVSYHNSVSYSRLRGFSNNSIIIFSNQIDLTQLKLVCFTLAKTPTILYQSKVHFFGIQCLFQWVIMSKVKNKNKEVLLNTQIYIIFHKRYSSPFLKKFDCSSYSFN